MQTMQIFLETDRLVLRRFVESDVDNLLDLDSDPEVMCFLTGGRPTPATSSEMGPCPDSFATTSVPKGWPTRVRRPSTTTIASTILIAHRTC